MSRTLLVAPRQEKQGGEQAGHNGHEHDENKGFHSAGKAANRTDEYTVNTAAKRQMPSVLPFAVGSLFVALFLTAGFWQLERRGEKRDEREAFASSSGYTSFADGNAVRSYERIAVAGRWLGDRQILLDNIIVESRVGHYVITPLETGTDEPLVLVNRGFLPQRPDGIRADDVALADPGREVRGRVGRLPRAGYRMGEAIPEVVRWPVHAVYPDYADIELTLGRRVQPFVLLLDAEEANGFAREWQPQGIGPGRHLAYAVQWFAMAAVLTALLVWHRRNRSFEHEQ